MEIVYKNTEDLQAYENNPRKNDKAVDAVVESIRNFGFKIPVVIDANDVIVWPHTNQGRKEDGARASSMRDRG